jgi:hypothetical protein
LRRRVLVLYSESSLYLYLFLFEKALLNSHDQQEKVDEVGGCADEAEVFHLDVAQVCENQAADGAGNRYRVQGCAGEAEEQEQNIVQQSQQCIVNQQEFAIFAGEGLGAAHILRKVAEWLISFLPTL